MEEMRSFGYICPACGKRCAQPQRFRPERRRGADGMRMRQKALTAETDGLRFRLNVPCGVCGGHHQAECDAGARCCTAGASAWPAR